MNIIIIIIIITNLYHNVQVFVLNKSMLFYVTNNSQPFLSGLFRYIILQIIFIYYATAIILY